MVTEYRNMQTVMGENALMWFIPGGGPSIEGTRYPLSKAWKEANLNEEAQTRKLTNAHSAAPNDLMIDNEAMLIDE
jgi:hypothetical protein